MIAFQVVVEGHGEEYASNLLVRRVVQERLGLFDVSFERPQRRAGIVSLLARDGKDLIRYQRVAEASGDRVLWLLDHDDGCPLESMGATYRLLANEVVRKPTAFAFLYREYETLFLEAPECCAGYYGLAPDIFYQGRHGRDAKGHISRMLPRGTIYKPTVDQAPLTARLDLAALAGVSRSYQHLESAVRWLCQDDSHGLYPTSRI